jgi:hypothetical protein
LITFPAFISVMSRMPPIVIEIRISNMVAIWFRPS